MKWTPKEEELLKKMCAAGKTVETIRKVFPYRTVESLKNKCGNLNLSMAGERPAPDFAAFERIMKSGGRQKCL